MAAQAPGRPPIHDPQAVPVVGTDAHLPPVPAHRLEPASLRNRFSRPVAEAAAIPGDGGAQFTELRAAAVLVPLVHRPDGLHVLLTRRTDHLHDHAGQVSFPGGRVDEGDTDAEATALRETEEEVGLARAHVELIGRMPTYTTVTRYQVTPVVGLVQPGFTLALDAFEVAEAFEVPLSFLMNPANHRRHAFDYAGARRQFLSMPWQGVGTAGHPREFFIWGATAAMLRNLYHLLQD